MIDPTPRASTPAAAGPLAADRRQVFDGLASRFEAFADLWDGLSDQFTDWLNTSLPDPPARTGGRVLDLGCGYGRHTVRLAERYDQVVGVDVSAEMLLIARRTRSRPNIDYRQQDALDLNPALVGQFDVVFSGFTLHHLGDPDVVLPAVRSLVAPGGALIVADMINPGGWHTQTFHRDRAFTAARVAYDATADREAAQTTLDLLLDEEWLSMVLAADPLSIEGFRHHYGAVLPGVTVTELDPLMAGAVWRNPDPGPLSDGPADAGSRP